ncbi:MAG: TolC family protein [Bacteroidota bacterium]
MFALIVIFPAVVFSQATKDTTYFNPLIDDVIQRIPPLEDLIDSAIVHNPQIKKWEAESQAWRYRVKSASRLWMRNLYLDLYLESALWKSNTENSINQQETTFNYTSQNNFNSMGYLEIKMPMFDLWDRKNQMKIATKEIEKAMASKDEVVLALRQTIITNYNQLIVNQKILKNANESVIAGSMNKEMGDKEFLNGQTTLYELAYIMEMYRVAVYNYETSRNAFFNSYMILQELCGFRFNVINRIE